MCLCWLCAAGWNQCLSEHNMYLGSHMYSLQKQRERGDFINSLSTRVFPWGHASTPIRLSARPSIHQPTLALHVAQSTEECRLNFGVLGSPTSSNFVRHKGHLEVLVSDRDISRKPKTGTHLFADSRARLRRERRRGSSWLHTCKQCVVTSSTFFSEYVIVREEGLLPMTCKLFGIATNVKISTYRCL